jgi:hypothetical protein
MPSDPGLAGDTCIFMEAIPGDGGNQNPNDVWWLSPDITLKGPVSGLETADQGTNSISIKFHRKPGGTCTFPGDESITVQVWVANPSLIMSPHVHGSAARVGFIGSPLPAEGATQLQQIDWTPPAVNLPSPFTIDNPQKPGPKCLVAICYPDSLTPSTTAFFVPRDQHVAQHNLSIVKTASTKAKFTVNTFNPAATASVTLTPVKLLAVLDLAPTLFVKRMVLSRLHLLPEFQQLRTTALPDGFGFDLTGLQATNVVDHSHGSGGLTPPTQRPSFSANVHIPGTLTKVTFGADLRGMQPGEAAVFHLTQTVHEIAQGGLTLVLLRT